MHILPPNSIISKAWHWAKQHPIFTSTVIADLGGLTGGLISAGVASGAAFVSGELKKK